MACGWFWDTSTLGTGGGAGLQNAKRQVLGCSCVDSSHVSYCLWLQATGRPKMIQPEIDLDPSMNPNQQKPKPRRPGMRCVQRGDLGQIV